MQQKDGLARQTLKINKTDKVLNDLFSEVWAIWLGGHFEKAAFSGGPYVRMETETYGWE